jgi:hypothetical protein
MKVTVMVALVLASILSAPAWAQAEAPAKIRARGGVALQVELATGGDELYNDETHASRTNLGQGGTLSLGGFYRPVESSPWEMQAFVGYKIGWPVPVRGGGGDADISRWVVQLLANYRNDSKWYAGGGLAFHLDPKYVDDYPGAVDIDFDNAVGVTAEAGWSWLGVQCTYMEYRSRIYGRFDASNCGVRFTWRFRKWRPLAPN